MSPLAHLQYGWWFAHWKDFGRRERAIIALAGAGPDLDGLSLLAGGDAFHKYHHILLHNVGAVGGALAIAAILYFVNPFDVIPDFIPGFGYLDDATVIGFVIASIGSDIRKFRRWERSS